jgi:hypothetical protein
MRHVFAPRDE